MFIDFLKFILESFALALIFITLVFALACLILVLIKLFNEVAGKLLHISYLQEESCLSKKQ